MTLVVAALYESHRLLSTDMLSPKRGINYRQIPMDPTFPQPLQCRQDVPAPLCPPSCSSDTKYETPASRPQVPLLHRQRKPCSLNIVRSGLPSHSWFSSAALKKHALHAVTKDRPGRYGMLLSVTYTGADFHDTQSSSLTTPKDVPRCFEATLLLLIGFLSAGFSDRSNTTGMTSMPWRQRLAPLGHIRPLLHSSITVAASKTIVWYQQLTTLSQVLRRTAFRIACSPKTLSLSSAGGRSQHCTAGLCKSIYIRRTGVDARITMPSSRRVRYVYSYM